MLILRKIIKIVATRCQILRLKCTKFDFGWGSAADPQPKSNLVHFSLKISAPDPVRGAYSAPPDSLAAMPYF